MTRFDLAGLSRWIAPLKRRVLLMIGRGVLDLLDEQNGKLLAQVQLLDRQVRARLEVLQHYGFASRPLPGAETAVMFVGGNRHHGLVIATDDKRYRLRGMANGEVALYTDEGDVVHLKRGGEIHLKAAAKVRIESPRLECTGEIIDRIDNGGRSMSAMRTVYNGHTHPGDSGGQTGRPGSGM